MFFLPDIGTWRSVVEVNFGTNQIQKLPDDIAELANLEVNCFVTAPAERLESLMFFLSFRS
jgi:hypothetical protein